LTASTFTLRPYQAGSVAHLLWLIALGSRWLLLVAPTGSGKTVMACDIIQHFVAENKRVMILVDARQLNFQFTATLERCGINPGVIMRDAHRRHSAQVVVATIQSLAAGMKAGRFELPDADLVFCDEAHKSLSPTWEKILNAFPADTVRLGCTATPCRSDGQEMGDRYDHMVIAATYSELIEAGYIVPCKVFSHSEPDMQGVKKSGGDYVAKQMAQRVEETTLIGDVFDHFFDHNPNHKPTICFAPSVSKSEVIVKKAWELDIPAAHIDGYTDAETRQKHFEDFEAGDIVMLSSCGVLREGVDLPCAEFGILLQPTLHLGTYLQMAGRLLRPYEGKTFATLLDHAGAARRHGLPHADFPWELMRSEKSIENVLKKKPKPKLRRCPKCGFERESGPTCPHCGFEAQAPTRMVRTEKGKLVEIEDPQFAQPKPKRSKEEKATAKAIGRSLNSGRNMTMKQAAWLYKQDTGEWPENGRGPWPPRNHPHWGRTVREHMQKG